MAEIPEDFLDMQLIPLGDDTGLVALNRFMLASSQAVSQKVEIENMVMGCLKNDSAALRNDWIQGHLMRVIIGMTKSMCCRNFSFHVDSKRQEQRAKMKRDRDIILKMREGKSE